MESNLLNKYIANYKFVLFIRIISSILVLIILLNLKENPIGLGVLIMLLLLLIGFTGIEEVLVFREYIEFKTKRILPFLSKSCKIKYVDIINVKLEKRKVNFLILILPGVGAINYASLVFKLKDEHTVVKFIKGNQNEISKILNILNSKIK